MPDAQNILYKALAVTFVKVQHLQKKAFDELYWVIPFLFCIQLVVEVMFILILFPYKFPLKKCKGALLVLLQYLHEDYSIGPIYSTSTCMKSLWRTSCFFQKGQSSRITVVGHSDILILGSKWPLASFPTHGFWVISAARWSKV